MSKLNNSTIEHLHFLLLEIEQQLLQTEAFFVAPEASVANRILGRAGYAENLRTRARRSLLSQLQRHPRSPLQFRLQAAENLVAELFQFSHFGRQAISDSLRLKPRRLSELPHKECAKLVKRMRLALGQVESALVDTNSRVAIDIDNERRKLTRRLSKIMNKAVLELGEEQRLQEAAEMMFPIYALRQMIALMGAIAESVLSANLGQQMNLSRYTSLTDIAEDVATEPENLTLNTIAETRSGSAISAVSRKDNSNDDPLAIFKEGDKGKVKEERASVKSWHDIYPGLAPKILSYHKRGDTASILIEHLPGFTLERIVTEHTELVQPALKSLLKTLQNIWQETRTPRPAQAQHMLQLEKRLPAVFQVHPEFATQKQMLCGETTASLQTLMKRAAELEKKLHAPFSVYIHGDFNLDNIIYDPIDKRINFIDLHRSRYMDYVQDVAVFMVSIYRLGILETQQRSRLLTIAKQFLAPVRRFAKKEQDNSFELRLTLGLIRSYITSTRFILDPTLSRRMFLRAMYLLNQITTCKADKLARYRLPLEELFFE
ncbi:phosphotransferase [Planctobacterium marinum]|uniref:phosphotransferase n=1 Tax=Planctobacterium marinum TaxID=1631968 RepID=UPI001E43E61F|nr:phosphotransferase [Planctobacterium marinum]MCC2606700.1 aminoglycoside phosphotransferase family protein [Planctobacterium marinum]